MPSDIATLLDLDRYPIDRPESSAYDDLVSQCRRGLAHDGMFNLPGFMRPEAITNAIDALMPRMETESFTHARDHNIYFKDIPELPEDHPALTLFQTVNRTLCADQLYDNPITTIYEFTSVANFVAHVMNRPKFYLMDDPLARLNVMAYRSGEALNWHFDRTDSTTTLLLQNAEFGGVFEYRSNLRTENDPNYDGVGRLLMGKDDQVNSLQLEAGTLNVFMGRNTAHRVSPVAGNRPRVIAIFSYYEKPGVIFSQTESLGFYGRTA